MEIIDDFFAKPASVVGPDPTAQRGGKPQLTANEAGSAATGGGQYTADRILKAACLVALAAQRCQQLRHLLGKVGYC